MSLGLVLLLMRYEQSYEQSNEHECQQTKSRIGYGFGYTLGARLKGENYMMLATIDMNGAQHIIDTANLYGLSINHTGPIRIVDFAEYQYTAVVTLNIVLEFVGFITGKGNPALLPMGGAGRGL